MSVFCMLVDDFKYCIYIYIINIYVLHLPIGDDDPQVTNIIFRSTSPEPRSASMVISQSLSVCMQSSWNAWIGTLVCDLTAIQ